MPFLRFRRTAHPHPLQQSQLSETPPPSSPSAPQPQSLPPSSSPQVIPTSTQVNALSLTSDARYLALGTNHDSTITNPAILLFDTLSNTLFSSIPHKSSIRGLSLNLDATLLAVSDHTPVIRLFEPVRGVCKAVFLGHSNQVDDVALAPSGTQLASAGCDTSVRLWDCHTAKSIHTMHAHSANVSAVTFLQNSQLLLSAGYDATLRAWDIRTARQSYFLRGTAPFMDCAADPDAIVLVSCGEDRTCNIWDSRNIRAPIKSFHTSTSLRGCDIPPSASRVVVSGDAGLVKVWDVANEAIVPSVVSHDRTARVRRCAISADGQTIVTAGMDNKAVLMKLPPLPAPLDIITDSSHPDVMPEIERLFSDYINHGVPLTITNVFDAIETDFTRERVKKLSTVYIGHLCVRTLRSSGAMLPDDQVTDHERHTNTFLYRKLYHRISEVVTTRRELDYAEQILKDAAKARILSQHDANGIIGDAQNMKYTRTAIAELRQDINELCRHVSSRIASMESRLELLTFDVSTLRANVDAIEARMELAAKVQRYANLVKFGLALIPFAGSAAMAFADGSASLIMSLDLEGVVELFSGLFSTTTQAIVDETIATEQVSKSGSAETEEEKAVKLVQFVLSDRFLNRMEQTDKQAFVSGLEQRFGGSLDSLRNQVHKIIEEHVVSVEIEEPSEVKPPILQIQNGETASIHEDAESIEEADLVSSFRDAAGDREKLSHSRACTLIKKVVQSIISIRDHSQADNLIAETLITETDDKVYSKVDEVCFVRSAKVIASALKSKVNERWGKEFDEATDDGEEIRCRVAMRLIAALVEKCGGEQVVADQITTLFGERAILKRDEFVQVARNVIEETRKQR